MFKQLNSLFILLTLLFSSLNAQELYKIATGSITGNYYPTGGAICRMGNKYQKSTKITFVNEQSKGSVDNIEQLQEKKVQFALVQSTIAKDYYMKEFKSLKSVMAIYPELLTFIVKKESNINSIHDLTGKKIFLGEEKSGTQITATQFFNAINVAIPPLEAKENISTTQIQKALNDNIIDGYFYMVGHPTANIKNIFDSLNVKLISFEENNINQFLNTHTDFVKGYIPANIYKDNPKISTFGLKALLVTTDDISNEVVYLLVKSVLKNFDEFKRLHPSYKHITKKSLLEGLLIPLHEGAKKYYKEAKLLQ